MTASLVWHFLLTCISGVAQVINFMISVLAETSLALSCASRYDHVSKLLATVDPYVTLWVTINEFYNNYATWMNGPFWKLSPEQVEAETMEAFRCDPPSATAYVETSNQHALCHVF